MARRPPPPPARPAAPPAPQRTQPPRPVAPAAGDGPAAAVLAALSAEPGGTAVAVIAGHAGISVAAARQALIAHEKAGTATRVKGGRPGSPDTWKTAAGPAEPRPARRSPGTDSTAGGGQPAAEPADAATEPDPAVTAEAAGSVLTVLLGGGLGVSHEDFTDAAARDPRRLAVAALVRCVEDERCSASFPHAFPAVLRVTTRDGRGTRGPRRGQRGGPGNPCPTRSWRGSSMTTP